MCGRYAFNTDARELQNLFQFAEMPETLPPRFNIGPHQTIQMVVQDSNGSRRLAPAKWALLPHWAKSKKDMPQPFNARDDKLTTSKMFVGPFAKRRCLVPATGFFEWPKDKATGDPPYYVHFSDDRPFAFGGFFNEWKGDGEAVTTVATITTEPMEIVKAFHDRSPLIIPPEHFAEWLSPDTPIARLMDFVRPFPSKDFDCYRAVNRANFVKNEGPGCIEPLAAEVAH